MGSILDILIMLLLRTMTLISGAQLLTEYLDYWAKQDDHDCAKIPTIQAMVFKDLENHLEKLEN